MSDLDDVVTECGKLSTDWLEPASSVDKSVGRERCQQDRRTPVAQDGRVRMRVAHAVLSSFPVRFLTDFWRSPQAALHRYSRRGTWPNRDELEAMNPNEFEAHMRSIGMVALPVDEGDQADADSPEVLARVPARPEPAGSAGDEGLGAGRRRHRVRSKHRAVSSSRPATARSLTTTECRAT